MTIGPDPITSTDFRSSRLGTVHPQGSVGPPELWPPRLWPKIGHAASSRALEQGAEVVEVVGGVVRAGSGLGVILHAEHRAVEQPQALHHAVVEVDVADHRRAVRRLELPPGLS